MINGVYGGLLNRTTGPKGRIRDSAVKYTFIIVAFGCCAIFHSFLFHVHFSPLQGRWRAGE